MGFDKHKVEYWEVSSIEIALYRIDDTAKNFSKVRTGMGSSIKSHFRGDKSYREGIVEILNRCDNEGHFSLEGVEHEYLEANFQKVGCVWDITYSFKEGSKFDETVRSWSMGWGNYLELGRPRIIKVETIRTVRGVSEE